MVNVLGTSGVDSRVDIRWGGRGYSQLRHRSNTVYVYHVFLWIRPQIFMKECYHCSGKDHQLNFKMSWPLCCICHIFKSAQGLKRRSLPVAFNQFQLASSINEETAFFKTQKRYCHTKFPQRFYLHGQEFLNFSQNVQRFSHEYLLSILYAVPKKNSGGSA